MFRLKLPIFRLNSFHYLTLINLENQRALLNAYPLEE